jgi:hypothetical protein
VQARLLVYKLSFIYNNFKLLFLLSKYKPTNELPENLNEYFLKQEKERYSLRLRHKVEQVYFLVILK